MITLHDFKYALRTLAKKPAFTCLAILIMAAGIGLSVYQFSFLNTLAYKPIPYKDGDSVIVLNQLRDGLETGSWIKLHDFDEIRQQLKGVSELIAYKDKDLNIAIREAPQQIIGVYTEPGMFKITRVEPILGRGFSPEDDIEGAENVIVLGFDLWQNLAGGDPNIVGKLLRVNGAETRVVGVMPEGYFFPFRSEAWLPARQNTDFIPREHSPSVGGVAHLNDNVSVADVNLQLKDIMTSIQKRYPETNNGVSASASTIPMMSIGNGGATFVVAMYVVAALLLVLASVNVGNLLLARAVERSKETAIRVALGAPRARIISQMLSESIIICGIGGVIGLLFAGAMLDGTTAAIAELNGGRPFYWMIFGIDTFTMVVFSVFLLVTIMVTGFFPAWKNSGGDFNAVLRDGTRGAQGKSAGRLNRLLVMTEVFLSVAVLIIAAVVVAGTYKAVQAEYGVNAEKKLIARIRVPDKAPLDDVAKLAAKMQISMEQSSVLTEPTLASALPGSFTWAALVAVDGQEYGENLAYPRANYVVVKPSFFESLGIELINGRLFDQRDEQEGIRNAIVTESFSKRHFAGESALGRQVRIAETNGDKPDWLTIVGVVKHSIYGIPGMPGHETGTVYQPFAQAPRRDMVISAGMVASEAVTERALRDILADIDPDLAIFDSITYANSMRRNSAGLVFMSQIFSIFAMIALGLAASGIYGVMSNTILQKTHETGVRRSLGADERVITRSFLWLGAKQYSWGAFPGALIGAGIGFAMTRSMPVDNVMLGLICVAVSFVIGGVVMVATYLPTRHALNMEPSQALRHE